MQKFFKLDSFISEKIWGGDKLKKFKKLESSEKIGETYEVSTHKSGQSRINSKTLDTFVKINYLVKFIDTSDNLSIQVHPGDEYAKEHENDSGKTECWYILEAEAGAGIYLGFRPGVTKKEFKNALMAKMDMSQFLNFIPIKRGDFFELPSGLIHAIGSGVTLAEVQQSSGVTYRVWDWNRVDRFGNSRELHIEKAQDVLNFDKNFNRTYSKRRQVVNADSKDITPLIKHNDFKASLYKFNTDKKIDLNLKKGESIINLKGELKIADTTLMPYESGIAIENILVDLEALTSSEFLVVSP